MDFVQPQDTNPLNLDDTTSHQHEQPSALMPVNDNNHHHHHHDVDASPSEPRVATARALVAPETTATQSLFDVSLTDDLEVDAAASMARVRRVDVDSDSDSSSLGSYAGDEEAELALLRAARERSGEQVAAAAAAAAGVGQGVARTKDTFSVTLTENEVELLSEENFLNDDIIAFYFEWLEKNEFSERCGDAGDILFMSPSVAFLTMLCTAESDLRANLEPLHLERRELIFVPVNDNLDVEEAGGTHWAVIVYVRRVNTFYYLDSLSRMCLRFARVLARRLGYFVVPDTPVPEEDDEDAAMEVDEEDNPLPLFHIASCPQQRNLTDCGLYVLAITERIARVYQEMRAGDDADDRLPSLLSQANLHMHVTPTYIDELRLKVRGLACEQFNLSVPPPRPPSPEFMGYGYGYGSNRFNALSLYDDLNGKDAWSDDSDPDMWD